MIKLKFKKLRTGRIKKEVININLRLLALGFNIDQIMELWEECQAEAQIRHNLPSCTCKDVNQCDTWCRAKARFVMNPPDA